MKNICLALCLPFMCNAALFAQEATPKDVTLDEVVVEAKNVRKIESGFEFIPFKKEVRRSFDGLSLVKNMLIPMLQVTKDGIRTIGGDEVTIYIDGTPATGDEIASIRPKDVAQVQVLENPSDPRFMGKPNVVNFVLSHPVNGGYVKANAEQTFMVDRGKYNLSGMYWMPKSTLLYSLRADYSNLDSSRDSETASYDMGGETGWVTRNTTSRLLDNKKRNYSANLKLKQAVAGGKEIDISAGVNFLDYPKNATAGEVDYDGAAPQLSYSNSMSKSYSPFLEVMGFTALGRGMLCGIAKGFMSHTSNSSMFGLGDEDFFPNSTKETAWSYSAMLQYSIVLSRHGSLMAGLSANGNLFRLKYGGTVEALQRINQNKYGAELRYWHNFNNFWRGFLSANLAHIRYHNLELKARHDWLPSFSAGLNAFIAQQHNLSLSLNVYRDGRPISAYNNILRQDNDLLGTTGNPNLHAPWSYRANLNYYWDISKIFGFDFNTNFERKQDKYVTVFSPMQGVMYEYTLNSGNLDDWYNSATLTIKLLDGSLALRPDASVGYVDATGVYPCHFWKWGAGCSVDYTFNDHLSASVSSFYRQSKAYGKDTGSLIEWKDRWSFYISGRYVLGDFFAEVYVNPLYKYSRSQELLYRDNVKSVADSWSRGSGRRVEVTLQYVIDFGKKVSRDEEYIGNFDTPSAIL